MRQQAFWLHLVLVLSSLACSVVCSTHDANTAAESLMRAKRSDDVSATSLQALVQQQAAMLQTQQAELQATRNTVQALQLTVSSLQATLTSIESKTSKAVAFTARISGSRDQSVDDGVHLSPHETIVFDDVVTSIGNAYNGHTGIFTAPYAGAYVFYLVQMAPNAHDDIFTAIVKNGADLDYVHAKGHSIFMQGSSEITVHLEAGDQVWVRQDRGDAIRGTFWTAFTGFLLHAD